MALANRTANQTTSVTTIARHGESQDNEYRHQFVGANDAADEHCESHKAHRRDRRMRKLAYKRDRYS